MNLYMKKYETVSNELFMTFFYLYEIDFELVV
jgi:hypothetical protein